MTANCEKCGNKYDGITHWKKGDVLICPSCMPNNQQKEEVKSPCCNALMSLCRCPKAERRCLKCKRIVTSKNEPSEKEADKPESIVTTLEEDRESLRLWESVFRQSIKDNMRSVPSVAAVFTNELIPLMNNLLAAKERLTRHEVTQEFLSK